MADEINSQPLLKKAKLELRQNRRHNFERVHKHVYKYKSLICEALDQLNSDWTYFCFVKILNCNADESCSFSGAYCKTVRNCQEEDADKRKVIWFPDLFNVTLVQRFIEKDGDIENKLLDKQISALEKLATFLDHISDTKNFLEELVENEVLEEGGWATVIGIHVLRKLAVHNEMKIDSVYPDLLCPCGCKTPVNIGDNSMGHREVWHGSVDILLGPVAVAAAKSRIKDEVSEDSNSAFELKKVKLEEAHPQLISESITFAFTMQSIVPLVGISKKKFGVFIYDPDEDLLFELTTMPLFISRIEGEQLHITSLVSLWMVVNFNEFFTGVKSRHIDFGYKADLKSFLGENKWDIYQHQLRIGGLRHVKSKHTKNHAGKNMGIFKRL